MKFNAHAEIQRTLKKLKRLNIYYNNIFHSIHLAVIIIDKRGLITEINPAACEMWDLSTKDHMGIPVRDLPFFSPCLQEKTESTFLNRNKNELTEWCFTHASGKERFLSLVFVPLLDDNNEIMGVILIGTDITSKKQLEKEKKILEGLLPICSHCKKIRDRQQNWIVLEQYIDDHSSAKFSHGICPDCAKKYYTDI